MQLDQRGFPGQLVQRGRHSVEEGLPPAGGPPAAPSASLQLLMVKSGGAASTVASSAMCSSLPSSSLGFGSTPSLVGSSPSPSSQSTPAGPELHPQVDAQMVPLQRN